MNNVNLTSTIGMWIVIIGLGIWCISAVLQNWHDKTWEDEK